MISTRLSITVLMTGHKDANTHDPPSAPQGSRQVTLTMDALLLSWNQSLSAARAPSSPAPEQNIERVRLRVAKGGHDVAVDKIVARYARSLDQLPWFLDQADQASVFDNFGASPRLIGQKKRGTITMDPAALPQIVKAVEKIASD